MTKISPAEAVRQFDVSKPTLYSDMNDGKLSYTIDDRKKRRLDVAELQRLYEIREKGQDNKTSENVKFNDRFTTSNVNNTPRAESDLLSKEIEFLQKEIDYRKEEAGKWQAAFEKAQETAHKMTLMLEDKGSTENRAGDWDKSLRALESRLANQERAAKEREEREKRLLRQNQLLKKTLRQEQAKTFWQKLFG